MGGSATQALPCAAAWRAFYLAAKVLDDIQDGDLSRTSQHPAAEAQAINIAAGLIAAGQLALQQLASPLAAQVSMAFNGAMLTAAGAQYSEFSDPEASTLDTYLPILQAKSGKLFGVAARCGGQCSGAVDPAALLEQFGSAVGILVQLADDLADFRRSDGHSDLATRTWGLPVLYALAVGPPKAGERLRHLLQAAEHDPNAEAEARSIVISMGGEYYLRAEMERYYQRALQAVIALGDSSQAVTPLRDWLAALREPFSL
jgi:geranylgeranyl pyrophosphate synthase